MQDGAPHLTDLGGIMRSIAEWDDRYGGRQYRYGVEPSDFLVKQRHRLSRGMEVLSLADGEGRNGVWLAQQGMKVTTVEQSPVGIQKALKLAQARGVMIRTQCADLFDWQWPQAAFDLVTAIFWHLPPDRRADIHRDMLHAVRPGGFVMIEAFHTGQTEYQARYGSGGPPDPAMLYSERNLKDDFADAEILLLEAVETELDHGEGHRGLGKTVNFVARRRAEPA